MMSSTAVPCTLLCVAEVLPVRADYHWATATKLVCHHLTVLTRSVFVQGTYLQLPLGWSPGRMANPQVS